MEHVNRLLDRMIVADIEERLFVDSALLVAQEVAKLVKREFTPIAKEIQQPCHYCGQGHYVLKARENIDVKNFGFSPVGSPDWRIIVCNKCGHTQAFRVDMASQKDWWK